MSIKVIDYTKYSFVVTGTSKIHLNKLKEFGGSWNSNLKQIPGLTKGWVFSNSKSNRKDIEDWAHMINTANNFIEEICPDIKKIMEIEKGLTPARGVEIDYKKKYERTKLKLKNLSDHYNNITDYLQHLTRDSKNPKLREFLEKETERFEEVEKQRK